MKRAVYAGSFDPITNGHLWMIEQGARVFDELIVGIGTNSDKKYTFAMAEREAMVRESIRAFPNTRVESFVDQFLVRYARTVGADFILRGIRNENDYEYERGMRHINSDLDASVTTVFMMPPREFAEVSSSFVRGLVGPENWQEVVKTYVPEPVYKRFIKKFGEGA